MPLVTLLYFFFNLNRIHYFRSRRHPIRSRKAITTHAYNVWQTCYWFLYHFSLIILRSLSRWYARLGIHTFTIARSTALTYRYFTKPTSTWLHKIEKHFPLHILLLDSYVNDGCDGGHWENGKSVTDISHLPTRPPFRSPAWPFCLKGYRFFRKDTVSCVQFLLSIYLRPGRRAIFTGQNTYPTELASQLPSQSWNGHWWDGVPVLSSYSGMGSWKTMKPPERTVHKSSHTQYGGKWDDFSWIHKSWAKLKRNALLGFELLGIAFRC